MTTTTEENQRHPAEERLLDVALTEVLRDHPTASTPSVLDLEDRRPRRFGPLAVAAALLGLGVTTALWWNAQHGHEQRDPDSAAGSTAPAPATPQPDLPQGPQGLPTLPAPQAVAGRSALADLPPDALNLEVELLRADEITGLSRFVALHRLGLRALRPTVAGARLRHKHQSWAKADDDCLAPLGQLPSLMILRLPSELALRPAQLAPLAKCKMLRRLELSGENVALTDAFVAALDDIEQLMSLRLVNVGVDADALARLGALDLQELELVDCDGVDAAAWESVLGLRSLRRLGLDGIGRAKLGAPASAPAPWRIGAAEFRGLSALPKLRDLGLRLPITAEELAALPANLTKLQLASHELAGADFAGLRRLSHLQHLDISLPRYNIRFAPRDSTAQILAAGDALAGALGGMKLRSLKLFGEVSPDLLDAIGEQPRLGYLRLVSQSLPAFDGFTKAARLSHIELYEIRAPSSLTVDLMKPLGELPALRLLELTTFADIDEQELQTALGKRVRVQVKTQ